jgi:hypothetical protein
MGMKTAMVYARRIEDAGDGVNVEICRYDKCTNSKHWNDSYAQAQITISVRYRNNLIPANRDSICTGIAWPNIRHFFTTFNVHSLYQDAIKRRPHSTIVLSLPNLISCPIN